MIYNKITLYDKQKVDYLMVLDVAAKSEQIDSMNDYYMVPEWDMFDEIKILAPFTEDFISSYISGLKSPVIGFQVYRQKIGDNILHKVADVDYDTYEVLDYLVASKNAYKYLIIPVTENEFGVSMETEAVDTNWAYWSLIQLFEIKKNIYIANRTWCLELDLISDPYQQNLDKTIFPGYTQYPKISVGQRNYITGGLSCKLGRIVCPDNEYTDTSETFEAWKNMMNSEMPFLLKDTKGNMFLVQLSESSENIVNDVISEPMELAFSFVEIGNPDKIMVYSRV